MSSILNTSSNEVLLMDLRFSQVKLCFEPGIKTNLFGLKNNKTVGETIHAPKYRSLSEIVRVRYPESIHKPLGTFLLERKQAGDKIYLRFLNKFGDKAYRRFYFRDLTWKTRMGLYCYTAGGTIMYIGQSKDSFGKRINQGYGNISPKNCYLDGQATNCHLNSLITCCKEEVNLFLYQLNDLEAISTLEKKLIYAYQPAWNTVLK